jgi:hypothetical protein
MWHNHWILPQIVKIMCGNSLKRVGFIDCKIITFKVKNEFFFHLAKQGKKSLNPFDLKLLHYTKLRLSISF